MSLKHVFVIRGKCVFLMSSYDWQQVRKCSSVSSWLCVQWEHSLSSRGASLLDGQAVFAESVSGQGFPPFWVSHGGQVFCHGVFSVKGQIACQFTLGFGGLFPMCKYFSFCFLIIWFCLMC